MGLPHTCLPPQHAFLPPRPGGQRQGPWAISQSPGALSAAGPLRCRGPAVPCDHYKASRRGAYIAPAIPVDASGHGFAHSGVHAWLKTPSGHRLVILVSVCL